MQKVCVCCGENLDKDILSLNIKLFGRNSPCYCVHCLASLLNVSCQDILSMIEFYRKMGCPIFI